MFAEAPELLAKWRAHGDSHTRSFHPRFLPYETSETKFGFQATEPSARECLAAYAWLGNLLRSHPLVHKKTLPRASLPRFW